MHCYLRNFCCALVTFAMAAAPAFAADDENPNIMEKRFDLTIWSIVIFALLYLVLRKFAWGPILGGLRARERHIESAIEESKKTREEMALHRAEFEGRMAEANQEIPKLIEQARKDAAALKEEMRTQASADIQTERQRLRREIEVAKDQALQEIWGLAANLATIISAKVVRRQLGPEDHRRLIDEALTEVQELAQKSQGRTGDAELAWVQQAGGRL